MSKKMIEVQDVTMDFKMASDNINSIKEYIVQLMSGKLKIKHFKALSNVTFDVHKGEVVGIIGHNGAGKSTILKVISGILKPTTGTVKRYGNIVPMLELGSGFDFELSGKENIYLNGAILGYTKEFLDSKYDEIVAFSELDEEFINMPIRNYSSGMLMRLAFSIATVVNPEILIVDEILAVGDASFQEKSKKRMLELMSGGTTVLFVSHAIEQIEEMCDRVVWLDHGKVKMIGEAKEICEMYQYNPNAPKEESTLYYDEGEGFTEYKVIRNPVTLDNNTFEFTYKFDQEISHFRFDPTVHLHSKLKEFTLQDVNDEENTYEVVATNATYANDCYYFSVDDSQIEINFEKPVKELKVKGKLLTL